MMSNISNKEKRKFDVALINSCIVYWYVNNNIIWEGQEMQENHFDNLPKSEQIALIDIGNKLKSAVDALTAYKHWFLDNN